MHVCLFSLPHGSCGYKHETQWMQKARSNSTPARTLFAISEGKFAICILAVVHGSRARFFHEWLNPWMAAFRIAFIPSGALWCISNVIKISIRVGGATCLDMVGRGPSNELRNGGPTSNVGRIFNEDGRELSYASWFRASVHAIPHFFSFLFWSLSRDPKSCHQKIRRWSKIGNGRKKWNEIKFEAHNAKILSADHKASEFLFSRTRHLCNRGTSQ